MTEHPIEFTRNGARVRVFPTADLAARDAAATVAERLDDARRAGRETVLGLATGASMVGVYAELVRHHRAGLSFWGVTTFNLDEYHPIAKDHPASFHRYMHAHLFDLVDLPQGARHVPAGWLPVADVAEHCREYEARIAAAGGIDLQLLGIGVNGHVAFNEPGAAPDSRTRRVRLHPTTLERNRRDFPDGAPPRHALTMGVATIRAARHLLLVAAGTAKAAPLAAALDGAVTRAVPASLLRGHPELMIVADRDAAAGLLATADDAGA